MRRATSHKGKWPAILNVCGASVRAKYTPPVVVEVRTPLAHIAGKVAVRSIFHTDCALIHDLTVAQRLLCILLSLLFAHVPSDTFLHVSSRWPGPCSGLACNRELARDQPVD